jgi:hypothetical protein
MAKLSTICNSISGVLFKLLRKCDGASKQVQCQLPKKVANRVRHVVKKMAAANQLDIDAAMLMEKTVQELAPTAWPSFGKSFLDQARQSERLGKIVRSLELWVKERPVSMESEDPPGATVGPMDLGDDKVPEYTVELSINGLLVKLPPRQHSTSEDPDTTLLRDLKAAAAQAGISDARLKMGSFWCQGPRFRITKRVHWDSEVMCVSFEPFSMKSFWGTEWSLAPTPASYKMSFAVFGPQALHDVWRRALRIVKSNPNFSTHQVSQGLTRLGTVMSEKLVALGMEGVPSGPVLSRILNVDHVWATMYLKPKTKRQKVTQVQVDRQASETTAVLCLLVTDQLYLLKKASQLRGFGGIQTNGFESRVIHRVEKEAEDATRQREKDEAEIQRICNANKHLFTGNVIDLGTAGVDEGMNGLDANVVTHLDAEAIFNARQRVRNTNSEALVHSELFPTLTDGVLDFHKQTSPLSVSGKTVECERRTRQFQKRAENELKAFEASLDEAARARLNAAGGLTGSTNWKSVRLSEVRKEAKLLLSVVDLRVKAYSLPVFREWHFGARTAVESLAARFFEQLIRIAGDVKLRTTAFQGPTEAMQGRTGILPGKRRHGTREERKEQHEAAKAEQPKSEQEQPEAMYEFTIGVGNWSGRAPGRGRGNNAFPRKEFMRKVRRLVYRYAVSEQAKVTRIIIGFETISEYRSSVQTPQPLPLVLGRRVNRIHPPNAKNAPGDEKFRNIVVHRPWKLLMCPETGTICQRDVTGAYAIALQHQYRRIATTKLCTEDTLPGYQRR